MKAFDKTVQCHKRKYCHEQQAELERQTDEDSREFWKKIGRTGVDEERKKVVPMEIYTNGGEITWGKQLVMKKWRDDFKSLLNPVQSVKRNIEDMVNMDEENNNLLNSVISTQEVSDAMKAMKRNKAFGVGRLPAEVLKSSCLTKLLTVLFNKCFSAGITPEVWKYGTIQPIPKSSTTNVRDPLCY